MEEKKRGGAREGSGRKNQDKTQIFLGLRYTEEEKEAMERVIRYLGEKGITKSKALLMVFEEYSKNHNIR